MSNFESAFGAYKLIYVFSVPYEDHKGLLKVGEATLNTDEEIVKLSPSCNALNTAALKRIKQETHTGAFQNNLLYTELAITKEGKAFSDHDVHAVLERSNIKHKKFKDEGFDGGKEWFPTDLETIKNAIQAVKENRLSLDPKDITQDHTPINLRKEQQAAVDKTIKRFKSGHNKMLWYAKMRFGKTLTLMKLVKDMGLKRTVIITHRPVVKKGWYEDFGKLFYDAPEYKFSSKVYGENFETVEKDAKHNRCKYLYFASIQDLRGSKTVGGNFDKNDKIFDIDWDLVVIDEAHEGTQTDLGQKVIEALVKDKTFLIQLSGTPFNLLDNVNEDEIFTWDYIMEQKAKSDWFVNNADKPNPYAGLPKLNIFTYDMATIEKGMFGEYIDDKFFNFTEFFRTNEDGDFVHVSDVKAFLDLMVRPGDSNYPFATDYNRQNFRHSLWMLPGVKEAKALSKLLNEHPVFGHGHFNIANVAGDGDEEKNFKDALDLVREAITDHPQDTYSITLSCGRLTTGVTVPEWTAVFMLSGSSSTAASTYMQTIFRVQSPANIEGRIKENCFVFDFAPDRALKCVAESVKISTRTGHTTSSDRKIMETLLEFCPVIAVNGSQMKPYNVNGMLEQLKKVYIDRIIKNGFDDPNLFNKDLLLQLDQNAMDKFVALQDLVNSSSNSKSKDIDAKKEVIVNENGVNEQGKKVTKDPKIKIELTEEEREKREAQKEARTNRDKAIKALKGIAIRIPMLIYGSDISVDEDIDIEKFVDSVDTISWEEFMPRGVDKEVFKKFIEFFDRDAFIGAGKEIRKRVKRADKMEPTTRVRFITTLFATFKNPDKETVLTPWRVVNMHMGNTVGGFNFYDAEYLTAIPDTEDVRYVNIPEITKEVFGSNDTKILEMNSKSGLYPLYLAYTLWRNKCDKLKLNLQKINDDETILNRAREIWDEVVSNNIYVICKTKMAKSITQRTLCGYRDVKVNAHSFENLITMLKDGKSSKFIEKAKTGSTYNSKSKETNMKFNAVVGNPPYQGANHSQIYPYFYIAAQSLGKYVSLIFPTGWQEPKDSNNLKMLNNREVKEDEQIVFIDNRQNVFPGISGAEWTNIILWEKDYDNGLNGKQNIYTNGKDLKQELLLSDKQAIQKPKNIVNLAKTVTQSDKFKSIQSITSARKPYGIPTNAIKDHLLPLFEEPNKKTGLAIYGDKKYYLASSYKCPKNKPAVDYNKYRVLIPYAWGNMDEQKNGLGGAFADIIIALPGEICTERYLVSGAFDDKETAQKHAKYLMTKFARALLYMNKTSQHSTTAWEAIPLQDYSEPWWTETISKIDAHLFKKYNIPADVKKYVEDNIQTKQEANIINFE